MKPLELEPFSKLPKIWWSAPIYLTGPSRWSPLAVRARIRFWRLCSDAAWR